MKKKYIVRLTNEERTICDATVKAERGKSEKLRRATILLKADADGPAWDDAKISEAVGCRRQTVENANEYTANALPTRVSTTNRASFSASYKRDRLTVRIRLKRREPRTLVAPARENAATVEI